jgi:hypothetical protein
MVSTGLSRGELEHLLSDIGFEKKQAGTKSPTRSAATRVKTKRTLVCECLPLSCTALTIGGILVAVYGESHTVQAWIDLSPHTAGVILPLLTVLTMVNLIAIIFLDQTAGNFKTYLHLEFAGTSRQVVDLFELWGPRGKLAMGISAGLHCLAAFLCTGRVW